MRTPLPVFGLFAATAMLACHAPEKRRNAFKDRHRVYGPEEEVDGRPTARMTVYEIVVGQATGLR